MLKSALALGAALCFTGTSAVAQAPAAAQECVADIKKLCAGVEPGGGKAAACIKEHFAELSSGCQDLVMKAAAVAKVCEADVKKLCGDVKPGGGAVAACLKAKAADISDACKEAAAQAKSN